MTWFGYVAITASIMVSVNRFSDKLTIVILDGVSFTVSLSAEGQGTTIVSSPPLQPSVDLGPYFSNGYCQRQFTLTNRWVECKDLTSRQCQSWIQFGQHRPSLSHWQTPLCTCTDYVYRTDCLKYIIINWFHILLICIRHIPVCYFPVPLGGVGCRRSRGPRRVSQLLNWKKLRLNEERETWRILPLRCEQ